jgi:hypothetical protein
MKNEYSIQFDSLNKEIVISINNKDYARATLLDQARQQILHELASSDLNGVDSEFFAILEQSRQQTSKLINIVEEDMKRISETTSRTVRAQQGYGRNL